MTENLILRINDKALQQIRKFVLYK